MPTKSSLFWHRVKFLGLIGVFLSPFIAGWMALYVFGVKPESNNYGTLIQPPKQLVWPLLKAVDDQEYAGGFGRKWTFLLFVPEQCNAQCQSSIYYLRQIKKLLGRNLPRLQNVLISASPLSAELTEFLQSYPDFVVIENLQDASFNAQFPTADSLVSSDAYPRLYLVDPDQHLMMHYPVLDDQQRILEDIRHLLKLSRID